MNKLSCFPYGRHPRTEKPGPEDSICSFDADITINGIVLAVLVTSVWTLVNLGCLAPDFRIGDYATGY